MNARFCKELGGRWDLTLEQLYLQVTHTPSWSTMLIQHAQYVLLKHANEARCYRNTKGTGTNHDGGTASCVV